MKARWMFVAGLVLWGAARGADAQLGFSLGGAAKQAIQDVWRKVVDKVGTEIGRRFQAAVDAARVRAATPARLDRLRDSVKRVLRELMRTAGGVGSLLGGTLVGPSAVSLGDAFTGPIQEQLRKFFEGAVEKVREHVSRGAM
jgi:hypothetical protein